MQQRSLRYKRESIYTIFHILINFSHLICKLYKIPKAEFLVYYKVELRSIYIPEQRAVVDYLSCLQHANNTTLYACAVQHFDVAFNLIIHDRPLSGGRSSCSPHHHSQHGKTFVPEYHSTHSTSVHVQLC